MAIALSKHGDVIYVLDKETNQQSKFCATTGEKIRGDLEMTPDEVLYRAWAQTQPIHLKEPQLRQLWKEKK